MAEWQVGAAGSNGGKVLGIVMPGGPLCAVDGADVAIKPSAKTATPSQMTCRVSLCYLVTLCPHGLKLLPGRTDFR